MELEGEGTFKLGDDEYNIKVIITKKKEVKKESGVLERGLMFLSKAFSTIKETPSDDKIKEFLFKKIQELVPQENKLQFDKIIKVIDKMNQGQKF